MAYDLPLLKPHALFAGDDYYPGGGWSDFRGSFDTYEEAIREAIRLKPDWYQVVHLPTGEIEKGFR